GADVNAGSRNSRPVRDHAGSVAPPPDPVPAPAASAAYTTDNEAHSGPAALAVRLLAAAAGVSAGPPRPTVHGVSPGRRHRRQAPALHLCFFPAQFDRSPVVGPLWYGSRYFLSVRCPAWHRRRYHQCGKWLRRWSSVSLSSCAALPRAVKVVRG